MPSKASHTNGNGHCKIHSRGATACRACLVQGLQEFQFTNLRSGLQIAAKRISALRAEYTAKGGAEVKATMVAYELGTLLARLRDVENRFKTFLAMLESCSEGWRIRTGVRWLVGLPDSCGLVGKLPDVLGLFLRLRQSAGDDNQSILDSQ